MKNPYMKKGVFLVVILLFTSVSVIPLTGTTEVKQSMVAPLDGKTLYVGGSGPGNYTKIQDAIDNASNGDTIYVYDDSSPYYESFQINKSINLIGEDRNTTILNDDNSSEYIIYIDSNNVSIREFTIQNKSTKYAIQIYFSEFCTISDNNLFNNCECLWMLASNNNIIKDNIFLNNNWYALALSFCDYNTISGNTFSHSIVTYQGSGINIVSSRENNISGNIIKNNDEGFIFYESDNNLISYNNITSNGDTGIEIRCSSNNRIIGNNISYNNDEGWDNQGGISFSQNPCNNNIIYQNNFINNFGNAYDIGNNIWDNGKYGNYWSDYKERYPFAIPKILKPWMWDTPYEIPGGNNIDKCPLVKQWPKPFSKTIPQDKIVYNNLLLRFLKQFPNVFPIFRHMLGLT